MNGYFYIHTLRVNVGFTTKQIELVIDEKIALSLKFDSIIKAPILTFN